MKCPKCGRPVGVSGEIIEAGQRLAVYQCEECLVPWQIGGETIDTALTFAVRPNGQCVDPADPTRPLNLN